MTVAVLPDDVAAGWRPLTDAESEVAAAQIAEALVLLGVLVPDLAAKSEDIVKLVVVKMVRRVLKNPDGYRIKNESIDDYTEGGTIDASLSTGELYASPEELKWLGVRGAGRAFEVRLA
ncbi:head-tail adaptor Ad1 [Arthrobacter phage Persistence]|uniref:Head-to-tail adaptor n=1 Tax=Arthrobacter phage Persistence TaxID=2836007 RepID=A0A8F3E2R2_9CAUD|nr:head-tail adaptor Ad1 [Arthrobacter phage Persistence]QWY79639.1 head-to-tail adaptor [Arthrobacter phage Persistence]